MYDKGYTINESRSRMIRDKVEVINKELGISYTVLCNESGFQRPVMSRFIRGNKDINDQSLDRLEPVVNRYMKMLEFKNEMLGVDNDGV